LFQNSVAHSQSNEKTNRKYWLVVAFKLRSGLVMALPKSIYNHIEPRQMSGLFNSSERRFERII